MSVMRQIVMKNYFACHSLVTIWIFSHVIVLGQFGFCCPMLIVYELIWVDEISNIGHSILKNVLNSSVKSNMGDSILMCVKFNH